MPRLVRYFLPSMATSPNSAAPRKSSLPQRPREHPRLPKHQRAAIFAALLVCGAAVAAPAVAQSTAGPQPLIITPVDESQRVVLAGNTRAEVQPKFDQGPVSDSYPVTGMQLLLQRSPAQEAAAEQLANTLEQQGSPQFHQWLTVGQYAAQFGAAPQDITVITTWLQSHGFTVLDVAPSGMTIDFSGTAGEVRQTFGTVIHALNVNGVAHIANSGDPSIPAALAPAIAGIVALHDFRPRPMFVPKRQYTFPIQGATYWEVAPADLATIYNFNPLFARGITGKGQTIALVNDSDVYSANDWPTFRKTFGLNAYGGGSLTTVHPGGCIDPGINPNGDDIESAADADSATAAAPSADLLMATCASTTVTYGGLIAIENLVNQRQPPPIISYSYGECEVQDGAAGNAAYKQAYLQAVLEGVSVFVAAADNGAAICDNTATGPAQSGISVNGLGSTAYNVAVGGTDFGDYYYGTTAKYWSATNSPTYGSALSYVPEIPWDTTCASTLVSSFLGFTDPYGAGGLCASPLAAEYNLLIPDAGGGGPSNCATGASDLGVIPPTYTGPTPTNGTCRGWPKPIWQQALGNPNDGVRDLPDVSMFAGDGLWYHAYVFCNSDPATGLPCVGAPSNWTYAGGTSFATPVMAGIEALVHQVWGRQGNPAPIYYAIAQLEYGTHGNKACQTFVAGGPAASCTFYDITIGDNDVDCTGPYNCFDPAANEGVPGVLSLSDTAYQPAYQAGVGWDFATGLGSVNATNLVSNPIWALGVLFGSQ